MRPVRHFFPAVLRLAICLRKPPIFCGRPTRNAAVEDTLNAVAVGALVDSLAWASAVVGMNAQVSGISVCASGTAVKISKA
jgi:hypothetical protein